MDYTQHATVRVETIKYATNCATIMQAKIALANASNCDQVKLNEHAN